MLVRKQMVADEEKQATTLTDSGNESHSPVTTSSGSSLEKMDLSNHQ